MRKKAVSPAHRRAVAQELVQNQTCSQRAACRILRLARSTFRYRGRAPTEREEQLRKRLLELSARASTLRVSTDRGVTAPGRLASGQTPHPTIAPGRRAAGSTDEAEADSARGFHWLADHGDTPEPCVDVGLHRGRDRAWWRIEDADDSGRIHAGMPCVMGGAGIEVGGRITLVAKGRGATRCPGVSAE